MLGYWNNSEATAEMIRDGVLHSGDAGYVDGDGYLFIQDRVKDMIVTGGENVFSTEVESVLHAHPGIADVAVIGTPDPRWGEVVTAIVVAADGDDLDPDEVVAFCKQRISPYKAPKRIEVVESLPRNSTGKLLKRELRERYWRGHARSI
jgi:acyl-CoA synthetase (AMP-forming)/AMP-acid ligase II